MIIVPLQPEHLTSIRWQASQRGEILVTAGDPLQSGPGFAGLIGDEVIFCIGRAHGYGAWAILSDEARYHMVAVTRAVKRAIELHTGDGRLEALVAPGFTEAHRWAEMLGFRREGSDLVTGFDLYALEK